MEYRIEERDSFSIIGQAILLTHSQKRNLELSKRFWQQFNRTIKKECLSQSGHWTKYAFMIRKNDQLIYYCALPYHSHIPQNFFKKDIKKQKYLVVEHIGPMDLIYQTYGKIYHDILPKTSFTLNNQQFLHFEKYDHRFHWNHPTSVIEIWVPII